MKNLTSRQIATVLAALRYWQEYTKTGVPASRYNEILNEALPALDTEEIDELCEQINCGD